MHRLAVMAQRLLRKTLRITGHLRPLGPRVTIGMERHAADAQPAAALLELRGAIARPHAAQVGKERSRGRQLAEQRRRFVPEVH